jgi:hypothetical protein
MKGFCMHEKNKLKLLDFLLITLLPLVPFALIVFVDYVDLDKDKDLWQTLKNTLGLINIWFAQKTRNLRAVSFTRFSRIILLYQYCLFFG